MKNIETARQEIQKLVDQFDYNHSYYIKSDSDYNETQLRVDFINQFLNIMGWDVYNEKKAPQRRREVVQEDTVEVDEGGEIFKRNPDYTIRFRGERKFFIEVKRPSIPITSTKKSVFQLRRYGWNAGLAVSILTNFDKLVIYDCRPRPKPYDDPRIARLEVYDYTEYVSKFEEIYAKLSFTAIDSGQFDVIFGIDKEREGTEPFDQYFLDQIDRWRELLAQNIVRENPKLSQEEVNFLIQRLMNRIIFLRICEDRQLEKYKTLQRIETYADLKRLFINADKRYNSSLFDFIEDKLSLNVHLSEDILLNIFRELYYPESPYAFSVVDPNVLGNVYEIFLAKEVHVAENKTTVIEKPEVIASHGIVPTPKYIVDTIVNRTLQPLFQGKSPDQVKQVSIADISCGSGTFLLAVYEYLINFYLEWYLQDGPDKHCQKVYQREQNSWFLTLAEKKRILLNHVFGIDIDIQAVEVTRFSLLLKVLEHEHDDAITTHIRHHNSPLLPDLRKNILCGNSLIDKAYFNYNKDALKSIEQIRLINPLDWDESFPSVMRDGGFDVIVGNPPYIRIQNMVHYSLEEVAYYKDSTSPYTCARQHNFDKYYLFIERAISLLKPTGRLGFIVPHKFFCIKAGYALRKLLSSGQHVEEIVHFGTQQVFGKSKTTYTCILILSKLPKAEFTVEHVSDIHSWYTHKKTKIERYHSDDINDSPWEFISPRARKLFKRLRNENPTKLEDIARIFVGIQTSADQIYIIKPESETETTVKFRDMHGIVWSIERSILRPFLHDVELPAFSRPKPNTYVIFPYKIVGPKALLYNQEEMKKYFPGTWKYLNSHKETLQKRDIQGYTEDTWYRYGRSQSLTKFTGEAKLIWPVLSKEPRYSYDDQNIIFSGGGNGPYYALRTLPKTSLSLYYIQAILSHSVFEAMIRSCPSEFRGGYTSHGKEFIKDLPIRIIDFSNTTETNYYQEIVQLVQQLITNSEDQTKATTPQKQNVLARHNRLLQQRIQTIVERLYSIDHDDVKTIIDALLPGKGGIRET
jgi:type I restriction-modification system DNA methylase subunit